MTTALLHAGRPAPPQRTRRLRRLGESSTFVLLLAIVGLPSVPLFMFGASSMATGALIVCLFALTVLAVTNPLLRVDLRQVSRPIVSIWLLVGLHFAIAALIQPVDVGRFAASWVLLLIFLIGAKAISTLLFNTRPAALRAAMRSALLTMLGLVAIALAGISPPASLPYEKPVFPFTEPSHFALSFLPFLLYFAIDARGVRRLFWIALGVALAIRLENMTLLAGTAMIALVCNLRTALVLLPLAIVAATPFVDFYYFATRLDFSPESDNLSTLVFVQGWQLIVESLQRSSFWGLGFQQLGTRGTDVPFAELIYALLNTYVNLNDGSFTLSKLASEFGIFGIALAIGHGVVAWHAVGELRRHARGVQRLNVGRRLACAVVVAFTVELVVRGAGYFTASSLLYCASLFHLWRRRHAPVAASRRSRARAVDAKRIDGSEGLAG